MAQYDGSVRIDTRIDTDGFVNGIKKMSSGTMSLNNSISKTQQGIQKLESEMEAMRSTPMESKELDKLEEKIGATEDTLDALYEKRGRLENSIIPEGLMEISTQDDIQNIYERSTEWQKVTKEIQKTEAELENYNDKLTETKSKEAPVTDSSKYQAKEAKLQELNNKLSVYNKKLQEMKQKEASVNTKNLQKLAPVLSGLNNKISNVTDGLTRFSNRVKGLAKRVFAFTVITQAFRGIKDYVVGSMKTNDEFVSNLKRVKDNLKTAFAPILGTVLPVLNSFMKTLGNATGKLNVFINMLFGKSVTASKTSEEIEGVGNAAKEASKQLAKYDELNVQNSNNSSGGSAGTTYEDIEPNYKLLEWLDKIKEKAQPTLEALQRLKENGLAKLGEFSFGALSDFYVDFLQPLSKWTLGEGLPRLIDVLNDFLNDIKWDEIRKSLDHLWTALEPFAESVGTGLIDFFEDLSRVGASFINTVVPGGLEAIADALDKIDPEVAEAIGYGLGLIATAVIGMKAVNLAANAISTVISGTTAALNTGLAGMSIGAKVALVMTVAIAGFKLGNFIYEKITGEEAGSWLETQPKWKEVIQAIEDGAITEITITPIIRLLTNDGSITTDEITDSIADMLMDWCTRLPIFLIKSFGAAAFTIKLPLKYGVPAIVDSLKEKWEEARKWWNENKTTLKSVSFTIPSIYETLKSRWEVARTWWRDKKIGLKTLSIQIPDIANLLWKAWETARNWWNTKKVSLNQVPINIPNILNLVSSAWKSVTDWWSRKDRLSTISFHLPNLLDSIKQLWENVKNWWNNNANLNIGFNKSNSSMSPSLSSGTYLPSTSSFQQVVNGANDSTLDRILSAIGNTNTNVNVYLQGDAKGVFNLVKVESEKFTNQTGLPAF